MAVELDWWRTTVHSANHKMTSVAATATGSRQEEKKNERARKGPILHDRWLTKPNPTTTRLEKGGEGREPYLGSVMPSMRDPTISLMKSMEKHSIGWLKLVAILEQIMVETKKKRSSLFIG